MRRSTTRWLPLLVTPLIVLTFEPTGRAAPILYQSWGDIGATAGVPIGSFDIMPSNGTLLTPGTFSLGSFQARDLPDGAGLTYTNLPFYIHVDFSPQGSHSWSDSSELFVQGVLNGTVTGRTSSDVVATLTSVQSTGPSPLPFPLSSVNILTPQTLAPSGINGGITSLMAQVKASPQPPAIPEPTPLAMMGILAVGAGLRLGIRQLRLRS
jgi:hypothetical protein